jgi:hypothetical protein
MGLTRTAFADEAADATVVHHAPISVADEGVPLRVLARIERPDHAKRIVLVYRNKQGAGEATFERSVEDGASEFSAEVPGGVVHTGLAYAIEIEDGSGARHEAFASRAEMHGVEVLEDEGDMRERAQLERIGHRRSELVASTEYAYFGTTTGIDASGNMVPVRDEYWRVDGSYTYRILRTVAEFGIAFGVVRGSSIVPNPQNASTFEVGLNYGAPRIRFRALDWLHFDLELLTSVTEVGFSIGGGGAVLLGSPYATHVTLGVEGVQVFGVRGWARVDIPAGRRFTIAPTVEVTNMPHAADAGVRLLLDAGIRLGYGFSLGLRGGYMARNFATGGFGGGAQVGYAF